MRILKQPWVKWLAALVGPVIWIVVWQTIAANSGDAGLISGFCGLFPAIMFYLFLVVWVILNNPVTKARREAKREAKRIAAQTLYTERPPAAISKTCSRCGRIVPSSAQAGGTCPHCGAYWGHERGARELVHKRCGKCRRLVSDKAQVGQKCPNCGTLWSHQG